MQRAENVIELASRKASTDERSGLEEAWAAEVARGASPERLVRLAFERCADMVLATAWRIGGSRFEAEDVCQTVFLALLDHAESLRDPTRVPGFLKTCAVREAMRLLRRRRWWFGRRGGMLLTERENETSDEAFTAARVEQVLARLGAEERAALVLKAQGHSHDEVAELLGTSVATARRRVDAARRKIQALAAHDDVGRAMLEEIGGEG